MGCTLSKWTIKDLHDHLQYAVDLEMWTIPFYMSAMYSVKDPTSKAYRLIQSVVHEEMLHATLASNIANAYGLSPCFKEPEYGGEKIPHLDFNLDSPNPTEIYQPYSSEIGPLDEPRINTMCLIEYPEWDAHRQPDLRRNVREYGSIGEFYNAVRVGAAELADEYLRGGRNQIDIFSNYFRDFHQQTVTEDGQDGLTQVQALIDAITDQGEGQTEGDADIPEEYRNTADGFHSSWPHFRKFKKIRASKTLPETWEGVKDPDPKSPGGKAQKRLLRNFRDFMGSLEELFSGGDPKGFGAAMSTLGANILTCWQNGAIPKFPQDGKS